MTRAWFRLMQSVVFEQQASRSSLPSACGIEPPLTTLSSYTCTHLEPFKISPAMELKTLLTIAAVGALNGDAMGWLTFKPLGGALLGLPKSNQDGYTTLAYFPVIIRQPTAVPQPPGPNLNTAIQNADNTCQTHAGPLSRGCIDNTGTLMACIPFNPGCP
ncbi:uncharacterized protein DFL_002021 [Arthrobotrys flagrans]|uniref:Uncharacterized protein n=1 Tax=Arthrobotrys flagrans TaxID=97331 RepID=A0A437A9I2_ARTFL|nr:hypothetical protein DFL_002021 [Arthrobotrys flagrans]